MQTDKLQLTDVEKATYSFTLYIHSKIIHCLKLCVIHYNVTHIANVIRYNVINCNMYIYIYIQLFILQSTIYLLVSHITK